MLLERNIFMSKMTYARALWLLLSKSYQGQIAKIFDTNFAKTTMKRAKLKYLKMIREAPSIGKNNPKLVDILVTALVASIYKSCDGKISPKQMGTIMTDGMESVYMFRKFCGREDHFCKKWQDKRNATAQKSQKREYSADFVSEFIYGETVNEYGIRYYECSIFKFLKRESCAELTPLMCEFDYVMAKYMNAELKRTKTLVAGGNFCDFWYSKK